jgi:hypothetical protein
MQERDRDCFFQLQYQSGEMQQAPWSGSKANNSFAAHTRARRKQKLARKPKTSSAEPVVSSGGSRTSPNAPDPDEHSTLFPFLPTAAGHQIKNKQNSWGTQSSTEQ